MGLSKSFQLILLNRLTRHDAQIKRVMIGSKLSTRKCCVYLYATSFNLLGEFDMPKTNWKRKFLFESFYHVKTTKLTVSVNTYFLIFQFLISISYSIISLANFPLLHFVYPSPKLLLLYFFFSFFLHISNSYSL